MTSLLKASCLSIIPGSLPNRENKRSSSHGVIDAPQYQVFKAHTHPSLIPEWWGPARYTTVIDKLDARPGGSWRFVQRDAAGNTYAFHGVYHDIVSPERIVTTFEFEGTPGHVSLETTTFEDVGGRTKITYRSMFQTVSDRDEMMKAGMEEGVLETMDRLAGLLGKLKIRQKAA